MKSRTKDVMYCGVDQNKIENANPILNDVNFKRLRRWIVGRYMVRKRKDVYKLDPPWTKDEVLLQYRFTNVKREHDRESRWLIENISTNPNLSYENKLINTMLFRMYNKSETSKILYSTNKDEPFDFYPDNIDKGVNLDRVRKAFQEYDPKYTFFTAAFNTGGMKAAMGRNSASADGYIPMRPIKFAIHLANTGIADKIKNCKTQEDVFNVIKSYKGLGNFLAYQIFVDFTYIPEFPFSENHYTVSGPGCDRGLKYIFEDFDGMNMEEVLFWLRDNIDREFEARGFLWNPQVLFDDLPECDRHMNIMSLENCMCEISKYIRALDNTGRPRNRYKRTL